MCCSVSVCHSTSKTVIVLGKMTFIKRNVYLLHIRCNSSKYINSRTGEENTLMWNADAFKVLKFQFFRDQTGVQLFSLG